MSYRHIHCKLADAFWASLDSYVYLQLTIDVRDSIMVDGQLRAVDAIELFVSGDECWIHGFQTVVDDTGEWTRQWRGTIEDGQVESLVRRYTRRWTMALHRQNVEREQARNNK